MILFWSLALLLLAVTLGLLLLPLLRRSRVAAPDPSAAAVAVYRDQKRALDAEAADGVISGPERDVALQELSRRLGEEVGDVAPAPRPRMRSAWIVALSLFVVIPLAAVVLYLRLGTPEATTVAAAAPAAAPHEMSDPKIVAMVEQLAQKMQSRPDDPQGWMLLARSYTAMRRFPEAADAYARATALVPDDAALLADYADALAMAQGRTLAGKPTELIERALAIDPTNQKALALAATAALDAGNPDRSIGYWRRLQGQFAPGSEDARQVDTIIAEIDSQRGGKAVGKDTGRSAMRSAPAAAPSAAASTGATIAGRVDIAPALAGKVALNDTVFIYARAPEGPRMPLAVLRIPARELPKEFTLDDSMSMAPGAKLSAAPAVVIEARVSKSGNALPQSGDLAGRSATVKPGAAGVKIVIDQVVP
jgi:cytochrome c-type biogenesis protein CcmH